MNGRPEMATPGGSGQAVADQTEQRAAILPQAEAERKAIAHRTALAALAGVEAHKLAGGGWIVSRWNLHRELRDDDEFDAWLSRVSGARP